MRLPIALLAGLLLLVACDDRDDELPAPAPAAFHPQQFPDVPVPPGFVPDGNDLLAVSYADGAVRRYRAAYSQPEGVKKMSRSEVIGWYQVQLGARGWRLDSSEAPAQQVWLKEHEAGHTEALVLETGRAKRRTIIRLSLAPQRL